MEITKRIVYFCAVENHILRMKTVLEHQSKEEIDQLVNVTTDGATPLVMACRNGHYNIVEYLLEECFANIEMPGTVVFDGETIESAPPLWCAAAAGCLSIVKLLLRKGAGINCPTRTNSTPLRAACFDGHFRIVKFLVEHGADIEAANSHGHTCLMIACYRGHIRIVKFLLAAKADANRKSSKGNTALHDCAESGSLEILKVLVKYGARMDVDSDGMTPLLAAAVIGHTHIVEHLIEMTDLVSRKEKIDALELLGATYVDKKRDMIGALSFWKRAMKERYESDGPVIPKPAMPVIAAYEFTREIADPDSLDDILCDPDEMRMQALVIRERILGPAHPHTNYYIRYRGAEYADAGKFSRCIELWNYALDLQQTMHEPLHPMTQNSFSSLTQLFSFMIEQEGRQSRGRRVPPLLREELMQVFKKAIKEVTIGKKMLDKASTNERDLTYFKRILVITLHLACLLTREMPDEQTEEYVALHKAIYELVRINAKGKQGRDVLQLTYSEDAVILDRYPACKFPSVQLTQALLKVGADVMAKDSDGNTVLHLTALYHPWRTDLTTTLLDAGAHIDVVNNEGKTFKMLLKNKNYYDSVNPLKYTTLACLAARIVRKSYKLTRVPKYLRAFVQMH